MRDFLAQAEYSYGYSSETFDFNRQWVIIDPNTQRVKRDTWFSLFGVPDLFYTLLYYFLYMFICIGIILIVRSNATALNNTVICIVPTTLVFIQYILTRLRYTVVESIIHFGHGRGEPQDLFYKFVNGNLSLVDGDITLE